MAELTEAVIAGRRANAPPRSFADARGPLRGHGRRRRCAPGWSSRPFASSTAVEALERRGPRRDRPLRGTTARRDRAGDARAQRGRPPPLGPRRRRRRQRGAPRAARAHRARRRGAQHHARRARPKPCQARATAAGHHRASGQLRRPRAPGRGARRRRRAAPASSSTSLGPRWARAPMPPPGCWPCGAGGRPRDRSAGATRTPPPSPLAAFLWGARRVRPPPCPKPASQRRRPRAG